MASRVRPSSSPSLGKSPKSSHRRKSKTSAAQDARGRRGSFFSEELVVPAGAKKNARPAGGGGHSVLYSLARTVGTSTRTLVTERPEGEAVLDIFESSRTLTDIDEEIPLIPWYERVLHPNCTFRIIWDITISCLVLLYMWDVPLEFGFWWYERNVLKLVYYAIDGLFWIDVILSFRTGFVHKGHLVVDPREVEKHYASTWLIVDVLAIIPFELLVGSSGGKASRKSLKIATKSIKLGKLLRIGRLMKYWKRHTRFLRLTEDFLIGAWVLHLATCFVLMSTLDERHVYDLGAYTEDTDVVLNWDLYATGMSCALVMMLGSTPRGFDTSFGSFLPPPWLCVVTGLAGAVLLIRFIADAVVVASQRANAHARFRQQWNQVLQEMKYYNVPDSLQYRVKRFFDYLWVHQKHHSFNSLYDPESNLSLNLRKEMALFLHRDMLAGVPLFKECGDDCTSAVVMKMSVSVYLPGDWIIRQGDVGHEMFVIVKGQVFFSESGTKFNSMTSGEFFGQLALLKNIRRTCSVQAATFSEIAVLGKRAFMELVEDYPELLGHLEKALKIGGGSPDDYDTTRKSVMVQGGRANAAKLAVNERTKKAILAETERRNSLAGQQPPFTRLSFEKARAPSLVPPQPRSPTHVGGGDSDIDARLKKIESMLEQALAPSK